MSPCRQLILQPCDVLPLPFESSPRDVERLLSASLTSHAVLSCSLEPGVLRLERRHSLPQASQLLP